MNSRLLAFTAGAGVGKTTRILADPRYEAIVSYTNAVAENAAQRGARAKCKTVYKLVWPFVKVRPQVAARAEKAASYATQAVESTVDPKLDQFAADAPSRQPKGDPFKLALKLHGWEEGPPPFDLLAARAQVEPANPRCPLAFALTLADFLVGAEADPTWQRPYGLIAGDEWQDFSALEVRVCLALADEVHGWGDPCQAIFASNKGNPAGKLPYGWRAAREVREIGEGGWRCGDPLAGFAARLIKPYYAMTPEAFRAKHETEILVWESIPQTKEEQWRQEPLRFVPPERGLAMGLSRNRVVEAFRDWGLRGKFVRIGERAEPDKELVLATIHNAKGYEADDCYLLPWAEAEMKGLARQNGEWLKLAYTALTRARRRVFVPRELLRLMQGIACR